MELEFIRLNHLPPLNPDHSSIPKDYFANCEWDNFYFLPSNSYTVAGDWMHHVFSYKESLTTFCWETNELVIRHKHDAYLAICEFDTEEEIENLAESFVDWLLWNEPCKNQLSLPWGESTTMRKFHTVNHDLYLASYQGLIENGVPTTTAKRASLVVAMDDHRLPNFGRTPEMQRDAQDACTWFNAKLRSRTEELEHGQDY